MARSPRTEYQEIQRAKAFEALALARREGISITKAAKKSHTTVRNVRNWSTALTKKGVRWHISAFDRAPRRTSFILPAELGGPITVQATFQDSRTISKVNSYMGDVGRWLGGEDFSVVAKWKGQYFYLEGRKVIFETDEEVMNEWARRGEPRQVRIGSG